MDYITVIILVLLTTLLLYNINVLINARSAKRNKNLPPGPTPLPIIGNLHLLGKNHHKSLSDLAQKHGPIMSLKLGQLQAVVITSPDVARQVLLKQDEAFSSRWIPNAMHALNHHNNSVVFLPATSRWRSIRKAMSTSLFCNARLDATQQIRSCKVNELLEYCRQQSLRGEAVRIDLAAFVLIANVLSCSVFSKNVMDLNSDCVKEMRALVWNIAEVSGEPNFLDFFPFLKFDIQGVKRRSVKHFGKVLEILRGEFYERFDVNKLGGYNENGDALDLILSFINENPDVFDHTLMLHMFMDLFLAGLDTTSSSLEWIMAELLKNPKTMKKAKQELMQVLGKGKAVEENHIDQLPYLQCIVKETLRLHPPVATLLPRAVPEDVELCGYAIPKETRVLVNVWAIGRDPNIWENPLEFIPERFLESNLDIRGLDFELLPFGSGRRICPGLPLARRFLPIVIGSLLNVFDWELECDMLPEELNMDEKVGIVLHKAHPLSVVPISI